MYEIKLLINEMKCKQVLSKSMAQEQPRKQEAVKYGDIFEVSGELASKPVAPQDAATMQAAENLALGKTLKGGPAAIMQSASDVNESHGIVGHHDFTNIVRSEGVTISEAEIGGRRIISEAVGGQVVGQISMEGQLPTSPPTLSSSNREAVTIGEALEATALSLDDKPVDASDAAAIQAAENRATGLGHVVPGGIAAEAQAAASQNQRIPRDEDKTKISDVLSDAIIKLPEDKPVTMEDAEAVIAAAIRNDPGMVTHPSGVASTIAASARLNQGK